MVWLERVARAEIDSGDLELSRAPDPVAAGKVKMEGDRAPYDELKALMMMFDTGFEILPGTGGTSLTSEDNPFEQRPPAINAISD